MSKLIIDNKSDLPMTTALSFCSEIVKHGRISSNGKQYCLATRIEWSKGSYIIFSDMNKRSDKLTIIKE